MKKNNTLTKKIIAATYDYVAHSVSLTHTLKQYVDYVRDNWDDRCDERLNHYNKLDKSGIVMANPDASDKDREDARTRIALSFAIEDLFRSNYFKAA